LAVDYLTRFNMGASPEEAFSISLEGASKAATSSIPDAVTVANDLLSGITGLDDTSIINACKLATFDVWLRNPAFANGSKRYTDTKPDSDTIENIRTMVKRSLRFWENHGPIVKDGFTFEPNGYSFLVSSGDGDYLAKDTLWDFKVSKKSPTSKHTLQLLMYWIMGQHSGNEIFKGISRIGIYNPRLDAIYTFKMEELDPEIIKTIETEVIGYKEE